MTIKRRPPTCLSQLFWSPCSRSPPPSNPSTPPRPQPESLRFSSARHLISLSRDTLVCNFAHFRSLQRSQGLFFAIGTSLFRLRQPYQAASPLQSHIPTRPYQRLAGFAFGLRAISHLPYYTLRGSLSSTVASLSADSAWQRFARDTFACRSPASVCQGIALSSSPVGPLVALHS